MGVAGLTLKHAPEGGGKKMGRVGQNSATLGLPIAQMPGCGLI
jgi:hypothetical protein